MFETSILLLCKALAINVLLPLIPGILLLSLLFWDLFKWYKLYIIWWFLGVGIVSHWMFDIQFIHFWVWVREYFVLILLLLVSIGIKIHLFRLWYQSYIDCLKLSNTGWGSLQLSRIEKWLCIIGWLFVGLFLVHSFVHTVSFPSYADDTFGNRHKPAVNIYYDGWVKMFGGTGEILGRARLWYPIHISIYKSTLAQFMGWWYETYANLFQWIGFVLLLILGYIVTFEKTHHKLYALIPSIVICWLPLVFRHVIDGYYELPSVYYTILSSRLLYEYLESKEISYAILWSFFLWILAFIKNDGFVVYMPWVIISFGLILLLRREFMWFIRTIFLKKNIWWLLGGVLLLLVPFLAIKQYYDLGFNQAQWDQSWLWISQTIHWEIFSQFKILFFTENNYNIILPFVGLLLWWWYVSYRKKNWNMLYLVLIPVVIFIIFTLVFLLTENYTFVMNQTTVNRTYMACFAIMAFYLGIIVDYVSSNALQSKQKNISTKNK